MKQNLVKYFGLAVILFIFIASPAMAIGLGGYLTTGKSFYDCKYSDKFMGGDAFENDTGGDATLRGIGFVLDTAVAKDTLFNYRLNLGYKMGKIYHDDDWNNFEMNEFGMYHGFGFGIVRNKDVRFWLGPQLGFGYCSGEFTDGSIDYKGGFCSLGPVLGVNLNMLDVVTFSFDCVIRETLRFVSGENSWGNERWYHAYGPEIFLGLNVICRMNDNYSSN